MSTKSPKRTELPQLELDRQVCFPLYAAGRAVTRRYGVLLAEVGLTYPQYLCLLALWGHDGPMSVGELGEQLRLDSGTLTPVLKRLEVAGHVVRRRDPADERRVLLDVTDAGWALRDQVADVPERLIASLGLPATKARQLRSLLDELIESLDEGDEGQD
jgi:MarR family transcriptional regulator, organic hydroperoxide resistance regulator